MNSKNAVLSIALLAALASSWWLMQSFFIQHSLVPAQHEAESPDGFMTQVHYTHYDENGEIQSKLYSPKIIHYNENDRAQLEKPSLVMHTQDKQTWIITADQGTSLHGSKQIDLKNNVQVQRVKDPSHINTLTTSSLTAFPDRQFAQTDKAVTIVQPGSTVQAVGMTANLKTGDITLLSQTQGIYNQTTKG